jgi:hypothetical protein
MTTETLRERFEKAALHNKHWNMRRDERGYWDMNVERAWQAVQAMHSGNDADQVLVSKADLRDWQAQYTEENADGEHDCITPYDKYLY